MASGGLWDNQVEFVDASYGKTGVKILYVNRDSSRHDISEYEGKVNRASPLERLCM